MLGRVALILVITLAQYVGAGAMSLSSAEVASCGDAIALERIQCCGEGCTCTPDSCPCARPADRSERIPAPVPAQATAPHRIDLYAAEQIRPRCTITFTHVMRSSSGAVVASVPARAKVRATLGTWTT